MTDQERKAFYHSQAWLRTREAVLARDNHLCQRCLRQGYVTPANTVHHIEELEEAPERALDIDNLESVCPACHNLLHPGKGFGHKDLRKRIVVVLGYPASGKTTYVSRMMGEHDIVLDLDRLVSAMTGREPHDRAGSGMYAVAIADDLMSHVIRDVRAKGYVFDTLWIVRTRLSDEEFHALRAARARLYWLDVDRETCAERLKAQGREDVAEAFDKCDEFMREHGQRIERVRQTPPLPGKSVMSRGGPVGGGSFSARMKIT